MTVSVALLPHPAAASATMELVYDPSQLTPVGPDSGSANGRLPVQLSRSGSVARADVKFRVVGNVPTRTQLTIENAMARDAAQSSLPVVPPPPVTIELAP